MNMQGRVLAVRSSPRPSSRASRCLVNQSPSKCSLSGSCKTKLHQVQTNSSSNAKQADQTKLQCQRMYLSPIQMKFLREKAHRIALYVLTKNSSRDGKPKAVHSASKLPTEHHHSTHGSTATTINTMRSTFQSHTDESATICDRDNVDTQRDNSDRNTTWSKMQRKYNAKAFIQKSSKRRLAKVTVCGKFTGKEEDVVEGFFSDNTSSFKREMRLHHVEHFVDARVFQIRHKSLANRDKFSFCGLKSVQCRATSVRHANCIYQMTFVEYSGTFLDPTTRSRTLIKVLLVIDPRKIPSNGREVMDHQEAVVYLFQRDSQNSKIDVTLQCFMRKKLNLKLPMVLTTKTIWIWWKAIGTILTEAQYRRMKVLTKSEWVPNDKRTHCIACSKKFTAFRHRHHCRACGEIMCSNCTRKSPNLAVRLKGTLHDKFCVLCVQRLQQVGARQTASTAAFNNARPTTKSTIHVKEVVAKKQSESRDSEFSIAPISEIITDQTREDEDLEFTISIHDVPVERESNTPTQHVQSDKDIIEELDTAQMARCMQPIHESGVPFTQSHPSGSSVDSTSEPTFDLSSLPSRERQCLQLLQKAHETLCATELRTRRNFEILPKARIDEQQNGEEPTVCVKGVVQQQEV